MFPKCAPFSLLLASLDIELYLLQLQLHKASPGLVTASLKVEPYNCAFVAYISAMSQIDTFCQ